MHPSRVALVLSHISSVVLLLLNLPARAFTMLPKLSLSFPVFLPRSNLIFKSTSPQRDFLHTLRLQSFFYFLFFHKSYLGLVVLFVPESLRLLKFSIYLGPGSLCGPVLEAEKYGTGLGS